MNFCAATVLRLAHCSRDIATGFLRERRSAVDAWLRSSSGCDVRAVAGGASGSVTVGYGKFREQRGGTRSRGGNRLPLGDQESVGCNAQRGVVMEAAPTTPFKVAEPNLLLKLLIVALDAPAQFGDVDQPAERRCLSQGSRASIWSARPRPRATRSAATLPVGPG